MTQPDLFPAKEVRHCTFDDIGVSMLDLRDDYKTHHGWSCLDLNPNLDRKHVIPMGCMVSVETSDAFLLVGHRYIYA